MTATTHQPPPPPTRPGSALPPQSGRELASRSASGPVAPVPYRRQALEGPRPRWWRPILTVLLSAAAYASFFTIGTVALVLALPEWTERILAGPLDT
ncbi:MAG TPA: hypothetical protein PKA93_11295, partial [Arachnia sp.]|nr:hypothetical protein [Arachnia sp.]